MRRYRCPECSGEHYGRTLISAPPDDVCSTCYDAKDPDEFTSDAAIRCPKCGHLHFDDLSDMVVDGEVAEATCGECDHEFRVRVDYAITYTSPERIT